MTKWMLRTLSLVMLIVFNAPVTAQSADLTGEWEVNLKTPEGEHSMTATLKQEGQNISGEVRGKFKTISTPIEGTLRGKDVKVFVTLQTWFSQKPIKLTLTGELDGDSLRGNADFGGFAEGAWTAKRLPAIIPTTRSAPDDGSQSGEKTDVSGTWSFEVETPAASSYPSFSFKQEGAKITGVGKGAFGEVALIGTSKGNDINFSFTVTTQGADVTIIYSGIVENNSIKGTVLIGETGSGTWIAKRSVVSR